MDNQPGAAPAAAGPPFFMDGGHMVTRDEMLRIARRYDTLPARAMLAALGHDAPETRRRPCPVARVGATARDARRYRAMRWCFENHGSPMR